MQAMLPQCLPNVSLPLLLTTSQSPNIDPSPSRVTFAPLTSSLTCFWVDCAISSYHWFPSPEVQFPLGPFLTFRTALVLPLLRILRWPPLTLGGEKAKLLTCVLLPRSPVSSYAIPTAASYKAAFLFYWPCCKACRILVPWLGIKPMPSAVKAQTPNHCTTRKLPNASCKLELFFPTTSSSFMLSRFLNVSSFSGLPFHRSAMWRTLYLLLKIQLSCLFFQEAFPDLSSLHQELQLRFLHTG